ncbi:T-box-containing protein [Trichinella pseudospiralis]
MIHPPKVFCVLFLFFRLDKNNCVSCWSASPVADLQTVGVVTVDKYGSVGQQEIQVVRSTWDGLLKNCPNKPVPGDNRLLGVALVASCTAPYMKRARSGTSDSNWSAQLTDNIATA